MSKRAGIQLAYPFEEKRLAKWNPPYIVQPKFDGDRCSNTPLETGALLLSSEENPFFSVPHINEQLFERGHHIRPLDGELYNHQLFLEGGHELIHSIASRTVNIHPRYKEMEFHVFDIKYHITTQTNRILYLKKLSKEFGPNIKLAPFWMCDTLDQIKRIYDKVIKKGYEGIIVRHFLGDYREKRSIFMMKFKPKKTDEYVAVGWKEEIAKDGTPKGRIGSIICSSQAGDEFAVGAGLNDHQKYKLWQDRDLIIGKKVIVHYQHLTNKQIPKGSFDLEIPELEIN